MTKEERIGEYVDKYVILNGLDKEGIANFKQLVKDVCTECVKNEVAELEQENAELKNKLENIRYYLDNEIPHELINEATTIIYKMV